MKVTRRFIKGKLIKRYKRFFADIKVNKALITAHCPNTGSMMGLLNAKNEVWLSKNDNPKRKLKYTLEIIKAKNKLVGVNTHLANKIVYNGLSNNLIKSGNATDEKIWRFPLGKEYDKLLDCDIADVKNITGTKGAGSITAAQFLKRFVKEDVDWAHLDIAGVTWVDKDLPLSKKGGTGFGIKLINDYILNNFERK